jgi:hypothetical protein
MKVFAVVIRNFTDKLNKKHNRGLCESEEFWAGPLFWVLWWLNWSLPGQPVF